MVKFKVKPTLKENWRYISFELLSENKISEKQIVSEMLNSILSFLGELGASNANLWLIEYDSKTSSGIVRCSNKALTEVIASLATITSIGGSRTTFRVLGVSGTIKKTKDKYLNRKRK
ncbi:TPA: ribonuclease P protein component 2 [archaeon]|nr:ribonuclease P protein component 2 [Candidatus Undinarchaeales archaeon SRR5007147.bin71]